MSSSALTDNINWNQAGLIPAIAQDHATGDILMMAWMNAEALKLTIKEGRAVYWSRSREKLWRKGEQSGHVQVLREIRLDCDRDTVLLKVEQRGDIACHTGRKNCFFYGLVDGEWQAVDPVQKPPGEIYGDE